ncbi:hypothetical protein P20652_3138 [Pseudoalteromonas sp. BSi20652]|uniref:hypothetical protein n=1 Tax=Pseudoalteromonas sp. BSi20652 TaxID=388384 RepID=UPI00023196C1|nr:hypothetical protein [Pseudoalteromonas sp. BSi20652]GAA61261.1 hypothetical protein P20652_3138 [Pseudoalteromonas sp. BSi20652]
MPLKKLFFDNGEISDNCASSLVGHYNYNHVTALLEYKGYKLIVESCIDISLQDETTLTGPEILKLVDDKTLT